MATMEECSVRDVLECGDDSEHLSNAGKARFDMIIDCSKPYKMGLTLALKLS